MDRDINTPRQQIFQLTQDLFDLAMSGGRLADGPTYERRLETCRSCDMFIKRTERCTKCGCFCNLKARAIVWTCPIGKWEILLPENPDESMSE